jgi:hypothetical protein
MNTKQIHEALVDGAGFHLLPVTSVGPRRPYISILTDWLPDMGFVPGALVEAVPELDGGLVFRLYDEKILHSSELNAATHSSAGKLIKAYTACIGQKESPALAISGQILYSAGLSIGDTLVARYEYGLIRMRKLPDAVKVVHMKNRTKDENSMQKLNLTGEWLSELGFIPDVLLTAYSEKGCITFTLQNEGIEKYKELVRFARKNKMKLLQVSTMIACGKRIPRIEITDVCLYNAGINAYEPLLAFCKHSLIKLQKLHMDF